MKDNISSMISAGKHSNLERGPNFSSRRIGREGKMFLIPEGRAKLDHAFRMLEPVNRRLIGFRELSAKHTRS